MSHSAHLSTGLFSSRREKALAAEVAHGALWLWQMMLLGLPSPGERRVEPCRKHINGERAWG